MKSTPKSCSCYQCKHSTIKKKVHVREQRAFRRAENQRLKKGDEMLSPAPHGTYTG